MTLDADRSARSDADAAFSKSFGEQVGNQVAFTFCDGASEQSLAAVDDLIVVFQEAHGQLDVRAAIHGFLIGLGTEIPSAHPSSIEKDDVPITVADARVREALRELGRCVETGRTYIDGLIDAAEERGRRYQHILVAKILTSDLDAIFGDRRSPGDVVDAAVEACFGASEVLPLDVVIATVKRAAARMKAKPGLVEDALTGLIDRALLSDQTGIDSDARRVECSGWSRFICNLLIDHTETTNLDRIETGFYLGGILGCVLLAPFEACWPVDSDSDPDEWPEQLTVLTRRYATLMGNPRAAHLSAPEFGSGYRSCSRFCDQIRTLRGIGWGSYTDYLIQFQALSQFGGFWDRFSGLDRLVDAGARAGGILALIDSRGDTCRSIEEAVLPAMFRTHWLDRYGPGDVWDVATSLVPVTQAGHGAHWHVASTFPDLYHWDRLIDSAIAGHQFELAEAGGALWLLQLALLKKWDKALIESTCKHLQDVRTWLPYGHVAPVAAYLVRLLETDDDSPEKHALTELREVFGGYSGAEESAEMISSRSARTRLVSRLVGERFLRLPHELQQRLVDFVKLLMLIERHEGSGGEIIAHAGGQIVDLAGSVEALVRTRLSRLSPYTLSQLEADQYHWVQSPTLGSAANLLKRYHRLPRGVQEELKEAVPTLPWRRDQYEALHELQFLRNPPAHGVSAFRDKLSMVEGLVFNQEIERNRGIEIKSGLLALLA